LNKKIIQGKRLKIDLLFFSYDTEALNKQLIQTERAEEQLFANTFGDTEHKKITLGVQQLYIIGNISNLNFAFNYIVICFFLFYRTL
jgi:hypothetical protein